MKELAYKYKQNLSITHNKMKKFLFLILFAFVSSSELSDAIDLDQNSSLELPQSESLYVKIGVSDIKTYSLDSYSPELKISDLQLQSESDYKYFEIACVSPCEAGVYYFSLSEILYSTQDPSPINIYLVIVS